jgi:polyribonucleotide nucleotidyltransferase
MVESEADLLSEEVMLGAVTFGHEAMKAVVTAINELVAEASVTSWEWEAQAEDTDLKEKVEAAAKDGLMAAYAIADKMDRQARKMRIHPLPLMLPVLLASWKNSWSVITFYPVTRVLTDVM